MAQETGQMAGPQPGSFCWTEIASSDAEKCKSFYSNVFGWKFQDSTAVADGFAYHEFYPDGDYPSGGLYQISQEMFGEGPMPPPHFLTYVAVDDVDENAKLAVELGGKIIKEPMDIPNTGRFAIIQDPTGAMIATFKMKS
jgi:uncharacterized protein